MVLPIHCYGRNNGGEWRELVKNVCSYQVLFIAIETKDMDEDRRIIFFLGFHIDEREVFLSFIRVMTHYFSFPVGTDFFS